MTRPLSMDEANILAHVVEDPTAWWAHCQARFRGDPEAALAAKLGTHKAAHDTAAAMPGYMTRAEDEAARVRRQAPKAPTYRQLRAAAYAAELGREPGRMNALGDSLDAMLKQFYQLRLGGTPLIREMDDLLGKVLAIKARIPKPE
ncbi:MAG: hypothetical protein O2967_17770 [Proteobacteria bacterium]|nr:hypothetical protein [Pseudomonadota bacterium]